MNARIGEDCKWRQFLFEHLEIGIPNAFLHMLTCHCGCPCSLWHVEHIKIPCTSRSIHTIADTSHSSTYEDGRKKAFANVLRASYYTSPVFICFFVSSLHHNRNLLRISHSIADHKSRRSNCRSRSTCRINSNKNWATRGCVCCRRCHYFVDAYDVFDSQNAVTTQKPVVMFVRRPKPRMTTNIHFKIKIKLKWIPLCRQTTSL